MSTAAPGIARSCLWCSRNPAGLHDDAIIVRAAGELDLSATPVLRAQPERIWELPALDVLILSGPAVPLLRHPASTLRRAPREPPVAII